MRTRWIAADLGVSLRWVHYAMREPKKRPAGRCKGVPHLRWQPHPAGGRCVRAEVYVAWLDAWESRASADHPRA